MTDDDKDNAVAIIIGLVLLATLLFTLMLWERMQERQRVRAIKNIKQGRAGK